MTDQLKSVQRYFTCRVYYRCKLEFKHDYPDRLVRLKLESLELRRLYNDITMVYEIVHKLTSLNVDVLLSYHNANNNYHVLTRGHTLKLKKNRLDLMWLEIIFAIEWYLYGMDCQNMLLLLLHLHCSRNIYAPTTFHPISSLIGICKHYTCIIYQYPTLWNIIVITRIVYLGNGYI